jgi:molybdopterin-guanine dinucleotide biosynthesis protein MobB
VGWSGAGKTTLIERLVPRLQAGGVVVGYLKTSHHGKFDMDRKGKDTDRLFSSGAVRVGIVSAAEGAVRFRAAPDNPAALMEEFFRGCDLVLLEGFRGSDLPKIEVFRDRPVLDGRDPTLRAVVADEPDERDVPRFARDDEEGIARFVAGLG